MLSVTSQSRPSTNTTRPQSSRRQTSAGFVHASVCRMARQSDVFPSHASTSRRVQTATRGLAVRLLTAALGAEVPLHGRYVSVPA